MFDIYRYSDTETRGERGERKIISEQLQYDLIISQAMDIVEFLESDIKSDSVKPHRNLLICWSIVYLKTFKKF